MTHKIHNQQIQSLAGIDDRELHFDLTESHNFMIPKNQRAVINLFVKQSVTSHITIYCDQSSDTTIRIIILFPMLVDINLLVMMCGDHSKIEILSLCALAQTQSVKIKTQQIHCGKYSCSNLILQGLLGDHAQLHYDGTIRIEKDAAGTYALQNNKNILLSSTATAISIPNIEVLHHDVQCYHGAAVGTFDVQHMQYMQSRGLHESMIRKLLVQELFAQILQEYEKREFILQAVYEKI